MKPATAIIASRPFAISLCARFCVTSKPSGLNEKSPGAHAGQAALRRRDARRHLDHADEDERREDDVRVAVPEVPEDVHLRAAVGRRELEAGRGAEKLLEDDARGREHRDARVLHLGLAQPVQVDAHVVDLREAERVEARVARHRAVKQRRLLQKRHRSAHLRRHGGERGRTRAGAAAGTNAVADATSRVQSIFDAIPSSPKAGPRS